MRTKLIDLNDLLFEQLERLGNSDLTGEELEQEIHRAKAVTGVASQVIENASLILDAHKAAYAAGHDVIPPPLLLGGLKDDNG